MFTKLFLASIALLPMLGNLEAAVGTTRSAPPSIKVLLLHDKQGVVLEVKGKYSLYDPRTNDHISTRFIGKRKYIQALTDGLQWGEEFPGLHQMVIVPEKPETTTIVDGKEYRGSLYIYDVAGKISIVNDVNIEDYLLSILSPQQREPLPEEALASVAIAARTTAYYQAANPKTKFWAVDAPQVGYEGFAVINPQSALQKAIMATRYMILSRSNAEANTAMPFPTKWRDGSNPESSPVLVISQIPVDEAAALDKKGERAPQILEKAFPGSTIMLMYYLTAH